MKAKLSFSYWNNADEVQQSLQNLKVPLYYIAIYANPWGTQDAEYVLWPTLSHTKGHTTMSDLEQSMSCCPMFPIILLHKAHILSEGTSDLFGEVNVIYAMME